MAIRTQANMPLPRKPASDEPQEQQRFNDEVIQTLNDLLKSLHLDLKATPGTIPIGAITAWHKSLTGVPQTLTDGFVECNGQTLSDAGSPLNGQVIPNLNGAAAGANLSDGDDLGTTGDVFLRGDETSGATQFDNLQGHWHDIYASNGTRFSVDSVPGGAGFYNGWGSDDDGSAGLTMQGRDAVTDGVYGTPRTGAVTRPRNMSVVFIMRVK